MCSVLLLAGPAGTAPGIAPVPAAEVGSTSLAHVGTYRTSHGGAPPGASQAAQS